VEAHQLENDLALTSAFIAEKEALARNFHVDLDALLSEAQAAKLLGVGSRVLQKWRQVGGGPIFCKISSRCIRYRRRDLIMWIGSRLRSNTSEVVSELSNAR